MFWTALQQIWEVTLITHSSKGDNFQGSGNHYFPPLPMRDLSPTLNPLPTTFT